MNISEKYFETLIFTSADRKRSETWYAEKNKLYLQGMFCDATDIFNKMRFVLAGAAREELEDDPES